MAPYKLRAVARLHTCGSYKVTNKSHKVTKEKNGWGRISGKKCDILFE
jgi:hypothetical protein